MAESRSMNAAVRIKEINAAREKIGETAFLGRDKDILTSLKHNLCESLVRNDDDYESQLAEQKKQEALKLTEQERILESKRGKQEQLNSAKAADAATVKTKENKKRPNLSMLEKKLSIASEKKTYWRDRKERIAALEKTRIWEEKLVTYWRNLNKAQWEELYPQQTSKQKDGWERCETMVDSAREGCKKSWRRVNDRWRQVVKERMNYWDTLKKSYRGRDPN